MSQTTEAVVPLSNNDRFFIGGDWVKPSSDAVIDVIDSAPSSCTSGFPRHSPPTWTSRSARRGRRSTAGPWPRMTHAERAGYLRAMADELEARAPTTAQMWPRESGVVHAFARTSRSGYPTPCGSTPTWPTTIPSRSRSPRAPRRWPAAGFGLLVREPVGVVGRDHPVERTAAADPHQGGTRAAGRLHGHREGVAGGARRGLSDRGDRRRGRPAAGVLNVITADREVSELLVRDHRVDKIAFTGSTAAGRKIGAICGERIARCTLELGGKSAAVILDDADIDTPQRRLWPARNASCRVRCAPR